MLSTIAAPATVVSPTIHERRTSNRWTHHHIPQPTSYWTCYEACHVSDIQMYCRVWAVLNGNIQSRCQVWQQQQVHQQRTLTERTYVQWCTYNRPPSPTDTTINWVELNAKCQLRSSSSKYTNSVPRPTHNRTYVQWPTTEHTNNDGPTIDLLLNVPRIVSLLKEQRDEMYLEMYCLRLVLVEAHGLLPHVQPR
jgi:hypothetical protein